jgi:hypothetical protein
MRSTTTNHDQPRPTTTISRTLNIPQPHHGICKNQAHSLKQVSLAKIPAQCIAALNLVSSAIRRIDAQRYTPVLEKRIQTSIE